MNRIAKVVAQAELDFILVAGPFRLLARVAHMQRGVAVDHAFAVEGLGAVFMDALAAFGADRVGVLQASGGGLDAHVPGQGTHDQHRRHVEPAGQCVDIPAQGFESFGGFRHARPSPCLVDKRRL